MAAAEQPIQNLSTNLASLPGDMRIFSLTLRSLYAEKAVSGETEETARVNKLRDDTRRDAKTYANGILPICTNVVRAIKDFFENYQVLEFDEWKDDLSDIIKELDGYIQLCTVAVKLYKDILVPLKRRQDEARVLLDELETLTAEYDAQVKKLEADAKNSRWWAIGLSWIPGVNAIATPLLLMDANSQMAKAVAKGAQAKLNNAACFAIRDALIPALTNFINGLEAIAGFFNSMKQELTSFQGRAKDSEDNPKRRHFKLMKNEAGEIMGNCRLFFAVIPGMETDLEAIPEEGTDRNYVDKWLADKEAEIRREYEAAMTPFLRKALSYFAPGANRKAMQVCSTLDNSTRSFQEMSRKMQTLFQEEAFSAPAADAASWRVKILGGETLRTAKSYVRDTLPKYTEVVKSTGEFFRYYDGNSSLTTWRANLPTILHAVSRCIKLCNEAVMEHNAILVAIKKNEDEARTLVKELTDLTGKYDREIEALNADAKESEAWGVGLAFVPIVGLFATPALLSDASKQRKKVAGKRMECVRNRNAVATIDRALIPAMEHFIGSLETVSEFFKTIEQELRSIDARGASGTITARHYNLMRAEAGLISGSCQEFLRLTPKMGGHILAIPEPAPFPFGFMGFLPMISKK